MFKLIKYEIIGKYRAFGILVAVAIILNLLLMTRSGVWPDPAIIMLSVFIAGLVSVVLLIWCIGLFSQDLYEDKGYLTYILPKKGYSIVGSKIIVSLIAYIITGIITGLFIVYFIVNTKDLQMQLVFIGSGRITRLFVISLIGMSIMAISLLINIYFSISLTRMAITKKRVGKFAAFIVFIIISIIIGFASDGLTHLFPQTISLNIINGFVFNGISASSDLVSNNAIPSNISTLIFDFVLFWVFFFLTSYIIENKVDL
ncbi:hypothetical protein [Clostridium sp.]|jgi:hypothetical protein|uniref:hypothetical protein n=1 Tax=Clostridium sp. TaxID=1506 RepID=UPI002586DD22|nr:hypothetical protein [Clostridium sp.]MDF2502944.1 hypothetical protein [Clostridium sp.]